MRTAATAAARALGPSTASPLRPSPRNRRQLVQQSCWLLRRCSDGHYFLGLDEGLAHWGSSLSDAWGFPDPERAGRLIRELADQFGDPGQLQLEVHSFWWDLGCKPKQRLGLAFFPSVL